jgi:hypothetical protein
MQWISMEIDNNWCIFSEKRVKGVMAKSVRMTTRFSKDHEIFPAQRGVSQTHHVYPHPIRTNNIDNPNTNAFVFQKRGGGLGHTVSQQPKMFEAKAGAYNDFGSRFNTNAN